MGQRDSGIPNLLYMHRVYIHGQAFAHYHTYMNAQANLSKGIDKAWREAWTTSGWFDYCMQLTL